MLKVSSNASVDFSCRPRAEKRKGVRFDEADMYDSSPEKTGPNPATAEFLSQQGVQWNALAHAFDCDDNSDENGLMDELLHLCSWWGGNDGADEMDSDDDDDDWLADLNAHIIGAASRSNLSSSSGSRSGGGPAHSSAVQSGRANLHIGSVSSLRLDSLLRFDSKPTLLARRKSTRVKGNSISSSSGVTSCSSSQACSQLDADEQLENAFQGIVTEDNEVSQHSVRSVANADDFWGDVEF